MLVDKKSRDKVTEPNVQFVKRAWPFAGFNVDEDEVLSLPIDDSFLLFSAAVFVFNIEFDGDHLNDRS